MKKILTFTLFITILLTSLVTFISCNSSFNGEQESTSDTNSESSDMSSESSDTSTDDSEDTIPADAISYDVSKDLDGSVIAYLYKTKNAGTYTLNIQGNGKMLYETAPWSEKLEMIKVLIIGNGIVEINDNAFSGMIRLEEAHVPTSVTRIGKSAFKGCTALKKLTVPFVGESSSSNNTHIGYLFGAESYQENNTVLPESLKRVVIEKATTVGNYAFYNCETIDEIILPDTLVKIDAYAFSLIDLDSLTIPNSVNEMGYKMLQYAKIKTLTLPFVGDRRDNPTQTHFGYFIWGTSNTRGYGPETIIVTQAKAISSGSFASLDRTKYIFINGTATSIEAFAFDSSVDLEHVTINCPVETIRGVAFQGCEDLKSVILPSTVTSISERSFNICRKLDNIYFRGTQNQWNSITKPSNWKENVGIGRVIFNYKG